MVLHCRWLGPAEGEELEGEADGLVLGLTDGEAGDSSEGITLVGLLLGEAEGQQQQEQPMVLHCLGVAGASRRASRRRRTSRRSTGASTRRCTGPGTGSSRWCSLGEALGSRHLGLSLAMHWD